MGSMVRLPGLRATRLRRVMTQGELAIKAGVSRATINALEAGRAATLRTVRALAAALDVDPAALMDEPEGQRREQVAA